MTSSVVHQFLHCRHSFDAGFSQHHLEEKVFDWPFNIHQLPGLAQQRKVESLQQLWDSETLGRASQSEPQSFRPGIVGNLIKLSFTLTSARIWRSQGELAQSDQIEEAKDAWLLAASTTLAIGEPCYSGTATSSHMEDEGEHQVSRSFQERSHKKSCCLIMPLLIRCVMW